jgi:hypothetical protein
MQTILKIVHGSRGQASVVDDYLARFCSGRGDEAHSIEPPASDMGDVAFVRDDAYGSQDNVTGPQRARLGSFGPLPNQDNCKSLIIFMKPIILLYRPNGQNLRLWLASTSSESAGESEVSE